MSKSIRQFRYTDLHPGQASLMDAVLQGLGRRPRTIPPRFFYDEAGSRLFEAICEQPEYYPPDAEREILEENATELSEYVGPNCVLIEPGAGSMSKVRLLLPPLRPAAYLPLDISGDYLCQTGERLAQEFPWLPVHAICTDFSSILHLPVPLPSGRRLMFYPGSSLGNFQPDDALVFLRQANELVGQDGLLLIGVDTRKDPQILHAAYNDAAGVTAAFNRNLLERINRELNADFKTEAFAHRAFYNADAQRVEMHLISGQRQRVRINGHHFDFREGDGIHTECSYKYAPKDFLSLAGQAGFKALQCWQDRRRLFAVYLLHRERKAEDG